MRALFWHGRLTIRRGGGGVRTRVAGYGSCTRESMAATICTLWGLDSSCDKKICVDARAKQRRPLLFELGLCGRSHSSGGEERPQEEGNVTVQPQERLPHLSY
eukprot:7431924-Pyramimonas_sp.AAC.1